MKNTNLRKHAKKVSATQQQKEQQPTFVAWKREWYRTTATHKLINLLHNGFSVKTPEEPRSKGQLNKFDHPDALTARYRFYLHIADINSGYSFDVRTKAFRMLFGGGKMNFSNIFPRRDGVYQKELSTFMWFMRPKKGQSDCYRNFANLDLLDSVNNSNREKFWKGVDHCMRLVFLNGYITHEFVNKTHTTRTARPVFCITALRVILQNESANFIKKEILKGVKRNPHTRLTGEEDYLGGCLALDEIERILKCFERWCTPKALALIETCVYIERNSVFTDALSTSDKNALFLCWVEELKSVILPAERLKTKTALAAENAAWEEEAKREAAKNLKAAEARVKRLSKHD